MYNWTIDDLEQRLKRFEKLVDKVSDKEKLHLIKNDIEVLSNYIEDYYHPSLLEDMKFLELYDISKDYVNEFSFLWNDFKDFDNNTNDIIYDFTIKNCSLSKKDLLELTHDFYKNALDKNMYGIFMKNFYRRRDHVLFQQNDDINLPAGETINIKSTKESFLTINRNQTYEDLITTVHEYMHANSAIINPYHFSINKELYIEVDTLFMELIAFDYFENIFKDNKMNILKINNHINYIINNLYVTNRIKLFEFEKEYGAYKKNKDLRKALHTMGIDDEDLDTLLSHSHEYYVVGYIFALELYNMYIEDKEKALHALRKFLMLEDSESKDYYIRMKNLGLIPNLTSRHYHNDIKELSYNLARKKYN